MTDQAEKPNPGSVEARNAGCACPVIDNHYGHGCGKVDDAGRPLFYVNLNCVIHGKELKR